MFSNPQEQRIIPVDPAPSTHLSEVDPGLSTGTIIHHNPVEGGHTCFGMIRLPDDRLKPLAAGIADGDVWEDIIVVIRDEGVREKLPEWMVGDRG